jgi:hypothetical protein
MITLDRVNPKILRSHEKANEIAARLNADPEDDWFYRVEEVSDRFSMIMAYDENNVFVEYL